MTRAGVPETNLVANKMAVESLCDGDTWHMGIKLLSTEASLAGA